jgi:hypothetical protein
MAYGKDGYEKTEFMGQENIEENIWTNYSKECGGQN